MNIEKINGEIMLTNAEVAGILRTNPATLRKRIQFGMYKGLYRKEGKYTLWNKDKFLNYLSSTA